MKQYKSEVLRIDSDFTLAYNYVFGNPCIVFLHGLAGSKEYFEPVFHHMISNNFGILTLDLPGFGESQVFNGDYSMLAQARRINRLLEELGLENVYLVAHSFAGPIVHLLYQLAPKRVSGMVLAESAFLPGEKAWTVRITAHSEEEYQDVFAKLCAEAEAFYQPVLVDSSPEKLQVVAAALRQTKSEAMYRSSQEMIKHCQSRDLVEEMSLLPIPILYILGSTHRHYLNENPVIIRLQQYQMPIWVLNKSGHCMMIDNPGGFYDQVQQFCLNIRKNPSGLNFHQEQSTLLKKDTVND